MKYVSKGVAVLSLSLATGALFSTGAFAQQVELDTDLKKFSYFMGVQAGNQLKQGSMDKLIDTNAMREGIQDAIDGATSRVTPQDMQSISKTVQAMIAEQQNAAGGDNLKRAEAFLAENANAEGVQVTESGVQYRVVTEGDGPKPTAAQKVRVHYAGKLLDGTEFDSSYARGEPAAFGVGQVIKGWQEALQLMPVGSKWEVWIPPALGYGPRGAGGSIGPNEALHFTIELIEIVEG